jgi:hypothetical protein
VRVSRRGGAPRREDRARQAGSARRGTPLVPAVPCRPDGRWLSSVSAQSEQRARLIVGDKAYRTRLSDSRRVAKSAHCRPSRFPSPAASARSVVIERERASQRGPGPVWSGKPAAADEASLRAVAAAANSGETQTRARTAATTTTTTKTTTTTTNS